MLLNALVLVCFQLGKNLLIAPVFTNQAIRDSIYFHEGKWFDYWDGTIYSGKTTSNGYSAPFDKLPLFVKAGSIIAMYQQMDFDNERSADTLTLDVYSCPEVEFEMYQDEGSNRDYWLGKFAKTKIVALSDAVGSFITEINISAAKGDFKGRILNRTYIIQIHSSTFPKLIFDQEAKLKKYKNVADFNKAGTGWYYNANDRKGMILIKTVNLSTNADAHIMLK